MNEKELCRKEFTSDTLVQFNPPKPMMVWDCIGSSIPHTELVIAYVPTRTSPVQTTECQWLHCAELATEPRVTRLQIAKWLARGNGILQTKTGLFTDVCLYGDSPEGRGDNGPVPDDWKIRKWDDEEWHIPCLEYMELA